MSDDEKRCEECGNELIFSEPDDHFGPEKYDCPLCKLKADYNQLVVHLDDARREAKDNRIALEETVERIKYWTTEYNYLLKRYYQLVKDRQTDPHDRVETYKDETGEWVKWLEELAEDNRQNELEMRNSEFLEAAGIASGHYDELADKQERLAQHLKNLKQMLENGSQSSSE